MSMPKPTALPAAASKTPIFDENDFIMRQKYKKKCLRHNSSGKFLEFVSIKFTKNPYLCSV